jgi:hypothetical protein
MYYRGEKIKQMGRILFQIWYGWRGFKSWVERKENRLNTWLQKRGIIEDPIWLMLRKHAKRFEGS